MFRESPFNGAHDCRIPAQLQAQRFGYGLASQIIFGRTQSTAQQNDVRTRQRCRGDAHNVLETVADNRLEPNFNAKIVELCSEIERVSVLPERSKHLRTNGDDFRNHVCSLNH